MKIKNLFLLLILALPQPAAATLGAGLWQWISDHKAGIATVAALGSVIIYGSRKAQSAQRPDQAQQPEQLSADEKHDKELKEAVEKKAGADVAQLVGKMLHDQILAWRDREQLLYAVIPKPVDPAADDLETLIDDAVEHSRVTHEAYLETNVQVREALEQNGPIALTARLISPRSQQLITQCNPFAEQAIQPAHLYIKNQTNPREILHRPINAGQIAIIGYSDGDIQIHLSKTDCKTLIDLTPEQKQLIKTLFPRYDETKAYSLSAEENKIFSSLSPEMKACLRQHYKLETAQERMRKWLDYGAYLANLTFAYQMHQNGSGLRGTLASVAVYSLDIYANNKYQLQWLAVNLLYKYGPNILNKFDTWVENKLA